MHRTALIARPSLSGDATPVSGVAGQLVPNSIGEMMPHGHGASSAIPSVRTNHQQHDPPLHRPFDGHKAPIAPPPSNHLPLIIHLWLAITHPLIYHGTKPQLQLHKTANPRGLVLVVSLLDVDEGAPQVLTTHGTALRAVSGVFERVLKDVDLLSYQPTVKVPSKLADMAPFLRFLEAGGPKGYPLTETANTLHARPLLSIVAMCEAYAVRPFVRDMLTHHVDTHAALLVNSPRARADRVLLARLAHAARSPQLWRALLDLNQNAHHAHPSASSDTLVTDVEKEGEEKDGGDTHSHQTRRHKKPWWPSTQEAQALGTVPYCAILFVANESALGHDVRDLGIKYIGDQLFFFRSQQEDSLLHIG
ncbi:uncharacterized protein EHS24_004599 [Apiotrichum porosum]|uniref:BTB domain-containing protein n=1 Tax=Apiotrichum porosum TaxID=105984 RepID=A0A427Y5L0_9TREE|nr:uncharacterized protein EHS24_004599 [Apiotrichum porosum]RSH86352.1 hypothetical protein EHS24_004599 [Apiotrichum porosum]